MKGALVLWIGFALIAVDLLVTKQGQDLWNLFTQPAVPKDTTTGTFNNPVSPGIQSKLAQTPGAGSKMAGAIQAMSGYPG